jgi:hypothetical protein
MKIYFAGNTAVKLRENIILEIMNHRLLSYYYITLDEGDTHKQEYSMQRIVEIKNGKN